MLIIMDVNANDNEKWMLMITAAIQLKMLGNFCQLTTASHPFRVGKVKPS